MLKVYTVYCFKGSFPGQGVWLNTFSGYERCSGRCAIERAPASLSRNTAGVSGDVRQESTHSHGAALN